MLYRYVYTKCLDRADEVETEVKCTLTCDEARRRFGDKVMELVALSLDNPFVESNINIHNNKAVIRIMDTKYTITAEEDK